MYFTMTHLLMLWRAKLEARKLMKYVFGVTKDGCTGHRTGTPGQRHGPGHLLLNSVQATIYQLDFKLHSQSLDPEGPQ